MNNSQSIRTPSVDFFTTVKNFIVTNKVDLKYKKSNNKSEALILFLIDSSGSMMNDKRIAFIKGIVQETMERQKGQSVKFASIALSNGSATILSNPTARINEVVENIKALRSGGKTNMKEGFKMVYQLLKDMGGASFQKCILYIFTDGKINKGDTNYPFEEAVAHYKTFLKSLKGTTVVDTEKSFVKLGFAQRLAAEIGAKCLVVNDEC